MEAFQLAKEDHRFIPRYFLSFISSKFIVFYSGGISGGINEPALR